MRLPTRRAPLLCGFALALTALTSPAAARASEIGIDTFDGRSSVAPWTFYNGAEFPGATGSLTLDAGYEGQGALLAYDFDDGGAYVAAELTLPPDGGVVAEAVGFWARSPAGTDLTLRLVDSSHQTFQYPLSRPLWALDPTAWYPLSVPVAGANSWYGGPTDGGAGVFREPIAGLAILAERPATGLPQQGEIAFDDVFALTDLGFSLDPTRLMDHPAPASEANCQAAQGVNIHFTNDVLGLQRVQQAGLSFVRMDTNWAGVESVPGQYDFTNLDQLLTECDADGLGALLILDYGNPLYNDAGSVTGGPPPAPLTTAGIAAFGAFAEAAAQHFANEPVRFEVWNEPNLAGFWSPAPDAGWYAAVCQAAVAGVHQGNPQAEVTTGGLSQYDLPFFLAELDAGAALGADAVGVHPYRQGGPESVSGDETLLRSLTAPLPVWETEWGYSATWYAPTDGGLDAGFALAAEQQALYAGREALVSCAVGAPLHVYYDLRDDGLDPSNSEDNFGLLANDYAPKAAYLQVQSALAAMTGRTFAGSWDTSLTSVHALGFLGTQEVVAVVWSDAVASTPIAVTTPATGTGVDGQGHGLTPVLDGGQAIWLVTESGGPIYLTFPVAPPDAGSALDAGTALDAGSIPDAGHDAGERQDAGPRDAGAIGPADAGEPEDAGRHDAGRLVDAGPPGDAGLPIDSEPATLRADAGASSGAAAKGCGCGASGSSFSFAWLALLALGRGRRPRADSRGERG